MRTPTLCLLLLSSALGSSLLACSDADADGFATQVVPILE